MTVHGARPQENKDMSYPGKPEQLKLFMTGTEWQNDVTHSTDGPTDVVWKEKEQQSRASANQRNAPHGAGLYDSMKAEGFNRSKSLNSTPTIVIETNPSGKEYRRTQSEGHHRVAAAAAIERDTGKPVYLPTNYVDITPGARMRQREARARQEARELDEL